MDRSWFYTIGHFEQDLRNYVGALAEDLVNNEEAMADAGFTPEQAKRLRILCLSDNYPNEKYLGLVGRYLIDLVYDRPEAKNRFRALIELVETFPFTKEDFDDNIFH